MCRENNIAFIPLVPNSTHLTQPLDVAVFRPMKDIWFSVLRKWRIESRSKGSIPKQYFPALIKRVCLQLSAKNLISGTYNEATRFSLKLLFWIISSITPIVLIIFLNLHNVWTSLNFNYGISKCFLSSTYLTNHFLRLKT